MGKIDEETLIDALLMENPDSVAKSLQKQPEEESLFDILGLKEKHSKDIETMKFLARQGEESAIYKLGSCYMEGKDVEQDFAEACYWFEKSHDASSKMYIAYIHEREGNKELAYEYYEKAVAAREDAHNVRSLCCYALAGEMLKKDSEKAERYFYQMLECPMSEELKAEIPSFAYMMALHYLAEGNDEKGIEWLRICLRYDRNNAEAREMLQIALARPEKAEEEKRAQEQPKEQGLFTALFRRKKR